MAKNKAKKGAKGLNEKEKQQVKSLITRRVEKKYHNFWLSAVRDYSGTINDLTVIAQGDSGTSRDGDQLYLKSFRAKITWYLGDSTNLCRVIIFQYKDNVTPVPSDIIDGTYVGTTEMPIAPLNFTQSKFYNILYDKTVMLSTGVKDVALLDTGYLKIHNKKVIYNGGATSGQNKIWVLACTDSGAVAHPNFDIIGRIVYTDA